MKANWTRIFLAMLASSAMFFAGCDLLGGGDDEPTATGPAITGLTLSDATVVVGSAAEVITVDGSITADDALTSVTVKVVDDAGDAVTAGITIDKTALGTGKKAWDLETDGAVKITIGRAAVNGDFEVQVTAVSAGGTTSATTALKITVTKTAVTSKNVTLGAQSASAGSSLDADDMTVYTMANAKTNSEKIDVCFFTTGSNEPWLWSPERADNASYISGWATLNTTDMAKVNSVDFAAIDNQEDIDAIWAGLAATSKKKFMAIAANDVIILKTNTNAIRLMQITSASTAATGTAVLKGLVP